MPPPELREMARLWRSFNELRHKLRQIWRSYANQVIQAIRALQPCLRGACRHSPARCRCTAHLR
ncbi:hypothetical protein CBM2637_B120141 [Cupriavidus taiwanensis]|nr:hypothetical protein CBM2637_B120141 [Cupriavidus taiwanensis]